MTRILKKNSDLTRRITRPDPTNAHYRLFKAYVTSRHDDGQMARMDHDDFTSMINNSPIETVLVSHYDKNDRLVGSVLADFQSDGLSAVYSFFDIKQAQRSLGTYMVLDLLAIAKEYRLIGFILAILCGEAAKWPIKNASSLPKFLMLASGNPPMRLFATHEWLRPPVGDHCGNIF